jgi:tetratricopeptide (TPR) repeat protein
VARSELKTLSKENSDWVAKHLVTAALLIDDDPELAHQHAVSAGRRAGRVAVVRETLAITSYRIGDFASALRELRTYRRISGRNDQLPMMVDCERGLGRPERALELGRSVAKAALDTPVQVELAIAMSGARLDLGNAAAALAELEIPQLDPSTAYSWSPALYSAYAATLEELGRQDEADEWWARVDRAAEALADAADEDSWETIDVVEETIEGPDDGGAEPGAVEHGSGDDGGGDIGSGDGGGEPGVVGGVESDDLVEPGDGVTGDGGLDEGPDVAGGFDDDDIDDEQFEIDEENPTDVDGSGADR